MAKGKQPKPKWVTVAELAELLEITAQGVRSSYLPSLEESDVDRSKPLRVRFGAVLDLLVERRIASAPKSLPGDDPLLADGDSPALERYRLAKAKHAELDLEHRKGELIEVDKCRDVLARWAVLIRRMGDSLSKRHGNEAAMTVNDALKECREIIKESFGGD